MKWRTKLSEKFPKCRNHLPHKVRCVFRCVIWGFRQDDGELWSGILDSEDPEPYYRSFTVHSYTWNLSSVQKIWSSAILQISTICRPSLGFGNPLTTMYASPIVSTLQRTPCFNQLSKRETVTIGLNANCEVHRKVQHVKLSINEISTRWKGSLNATFYRVIIRNITHLVDVVTWYGVVERIIQVIQQFNDLYRRTFRR